MPYRPQRRHQPALVRTFYQNNVACLDEVRPVLLLLSDPVTVGVKLFDIVRRIMQPDLFRCGYMA
jgi:hypothetical protein